MPTPDETVGLTSDDIARIRANADDDVFYFGRVICGHRDLVLEDHAPLMYAAAGQAEKLLALLLSDIDSYTLTQFRSECARHKINLRLANAAQHLLDYLRVVDERVYRHSGKSSAITHAVRAWRMTKDPNLTSVLITNTDPKAVDFCKQIRATILSDLYKAVYPDRVPADPKTMLTESRLTLAGRTVPDMEPCLMAFGVESSPTGYHFDEFHFDDLVGRENKSPNKLALVKEFLANLTGLYKPGIRYQVRRIHVGTRWDEDDDAAFVRLYRHTFAVTIPVWIRDGDSDNVRLTGKPTTKWFPIEKIVAEQEEVLSSPDEGAISWRCNYELDPYIGGARIFPAHLVDQQKWTSVENDGRVYVQRPDFDEAGERLLYDDSDKYKDRLLDPMKLYRITACDQSFTEDGDEWAVVTEGMDPWGHRIVIERTTGHGVEQMLDAILDHADYWKPRRVGMEKIAAQHVVELVLKLAPKYRRLRSLIEAVPHKNVAKEYRIRNYVAEVMKMRRLWLDPDDAATSDEMKRYRPGPNAKDNILDAMAMCEVLIQKSCQSQDGEDDYKKRVAARNAINTQRRDKFTGVALW